MNVKGLVSSVKKSSESNARNMERMYRSLAVLKCSGTVAKTVLNC